MTRATNSGQPAVNPDNAPVPNSDKRPDGQHVDHWVLPDEERAKGFVRPVRESYRHVGIAGPLGPTRELTAEEKDRGLEYAAYEPYEADHPHKVKGIVSPSAVGRFWTAQELANIGKGCGTITTMPRSIAETYARQPGYYGSTFCCGCGTYLPVGRQGEFVWTGTDERVGT